MKKGYLLVEVAGPDEFVEKTVRGFLGKCTAGFGASDGEMSRFSIHVEPCTYKGDEIARLIAARRETIVSLIHSPREIVASAVKETVHG